MDDHPPDSARENAIKDAGPLTKRHVLLIVEMLLLTLSVMATEATISPAIPKLAVQYPKHQSWVPWTLTAYNVVGAVWTPLAGSLGDIFGVKWITLLSLAVYLAGEVGCALSRSIFVLIAFRGVQGVGMGIFTLCFTAIKRSFPARFVPLALGIVSSMFSVGISFGFVGGAAIIRALDDARVRWEYVFFFYVPFIVAVIAAFYFTMPEIRRNRGRRVDVAGAAVLSVAVVCFLFGLTFSEDRGWRDPLVLCLTAIGLVGFVAFAIVERFIRDPLVNTELFCTRNLLTIGCVSFLIGISMFSCFQILPYLYQFRLGIADPVEIGCVLLPLGLAQLPVAPAAALLGKKVGFSLVITVSLALLSVGFGVYIPYHQTRTQSVLINLLCGTAMGGVIVSLMNVVSEHTKPSQFGAASGTNTLLRILGCAVGPVAMNLIMFRGALVVEVPVIDLTSSSQVEVIGLVSHKIPTDAGYRSGFIFALAVALAALAVAQALSGRFAACRKTVVTPEGTPAAQHKPVSRAESFVVQVYDFPTGTTRQTEDKPRQ
eukprot:m51a1_g9525 hypothetical protein (543) ;mRNA; r:761927-763718